MKNFHAILVAALAACDNNQSGNVGATKLGDMSNVVEKGSPLAELHAACGTGAPTVAGSVLQRAPYLQQVTSSSAMIGWVSTAPAGEHVIVTTPAGAEVATAEGVVQRSTQRALGETQMWATLIGLEPDTIYCYALAADAPLTERIGMRTAPLASSTKPVRFLAFGDSGGGGSDQYALRERMLDVPYELIIHTGDVAYTDGTIAEYEDNVFGVYAELFSSIPFFPAAGNHDYKTLSGTPFRDVFALPGDNGEKWYSYDWGMVHFVALDTESDYATQATWLDADLAANDALWTIVYLHRPPYSSGNHGSDTRLRNLLAPVLEKHDVQLVLVAMITTTSG